MEIILYVSALIAALSLLLIAIFVVKTLKSAKQTIGEVSDTLKRMETNLGGITEKTNRLMEKTNDIADDAYMKLQTFDRFTNSAKDLGQATEYIDQSVRQISDQVANQPKKYAEALQQANALTEMLARVYYSFKREKMKR